MRERTEEDVFDATSSLFFFASLSNRLKFPQDSEKLKKMSKANMYRIYIVFR
jgi:hypothetical protein